MHDEESGAGKREMCRHEEGNDEEDEDKEEDDGKGEGMAAKLSCRDEIRYKWERKT